jgi:hypothetical protein
LNTELKKWFFSTQTTIANNFHISEAGRGRARQELLFSAGASDAHYGESAHNYNQAIDTFFIDKSGKLSYDKLMYAKLGTVPSTINWYGSPGSKFYERPHFEVKGWKTMNLTKVEA